LVTAPQKQQFGWKFQMLLKWLLYLAYFENMVSGLEIALVFA